MRESSAVLPSRLVLCCLLAATTACTQDAKMVESHTTDKPASSAFNAPETASLGQTAAAIAADL
jgi:hypothetical protein